MVTLVPSGYLKLHGPRHISFSSKPFPLYLKKYLESKQSVEKYRRKQLGIHTLREILYRCRLR